MVNRFQVGSTGGPTGGDGDEPPSGGTADGGERSGELTVEVITHWGEIVQGGVLLDKNGCVTKGTDGREVTVLATLPDPMFGAYATAVVRATKRPGVRLNVLRRAKEKARLAAQNVVGRFSKRMLNEIGAIGLDIKITVENSIPAGVKGAGSSSADTYAVIRVLNEFFRLGLTDEAVFGEMCAIEPSDPLPLLGVGRTPLAGSRVGEIVRYLPSLPKILVVAFSLFAERRVDTRTQAFCTTYTEEERHAFGRVLEQLERALREGDARGVCEWAQRSLELNQSRRCTPKIEQLLQIAKPHRAFLAGSHSGEALAFLLPLDDETAGAHGRELALAVRELGGKHVHVFKLPCGGHPCRMETLRD